MLSVHVNGFYYQTLFYKKKIEEEEIRTAPDSDFK